MAARPNGPKITTTCEHMRAAQLEGTPERVLAYGDLADAMKAREGGGLGGRVNNEDDGPPPPQGKFPLYGRRLLRRVARGTHGNSAQISLCFSNLDGPSSWLVR